jgi:hypothetical protein
VNVAIALAGLLSDSQTLGPWRESDECSIVVESLVSGSGSGKAAFAPMEFLIVGSPDWLSQASGIFPGSRGLTVDESLAYRALKARLFSRRA